MAKGLALALAVTMALAACGDDATTTTAGSGTTMPGATTTGAPGGETTTTTTLPAEPFLPGLDLAEISLVTPTAGGGPRPLLEWERVDGAVRYSVLVFTSNGSPWWSWQGASTEVVLGGFATEAEMGGPRAGDGVTWVVFASDAEGITIAVSPQRALEE